MSSTENHLAEPNQGGRTPVDYNLDRIDTRVRAYNNIYAIRGTGQNTDIYIFDSGIANHVEFNNCPGQSCSRVVSFINELDNGVYTDCDGHGTSVASVAAGKTWGIASDATLFAVHVSGCSGAFVPLATLVTYINSVRTNVINRRPRKAVANMSFFYTPSTSAVETALNNLIAADVLVVGATVQALAGQSTNHNDYFPMKMPNVLRVGMTDNFDRKFDAGLLLGSVCMPLGGCTETAYSQTTGTDIFAPSGPKMSGQFGSTADRLGVPTAPLTTSSTTPVYKAGTSYATPLVAGVAAVFLTNASTTNIVKWQTARDAILKNASTGYVTFRTGNDPDKLLYSNFGAAAARNSASFSEGSAPNSLVTAFSDFNLGPAIVTIREPLTGVGFPCAISFTSGSQVNFAVPNIPTGGYSVEYTNLNGDLLGFGAIHLDTISPGLFSHDGDGNGIAAGQMYLYGPSTQNPTIIPLLTGGNGWNPGAGETAYLVIYGTGIRGHNGQAYVQIKKDSTIYFSPTHFQVLYAGQSSSPGQDQVNIGPLPTSLLSSGGGGGTWDIKLYLNAPPGQSGSVLANIVQVKFN